MILTKFYLCLANVHQKITYYRRFCALSRSFPPFPAQSCLWHLSCKFTIIGLSGNFNIVFSRRAFSCCVPLSCVYSDGDGCFVYKVTQKKTIFGIENTVVKEAVQLQAQDDKYAAINCSVSKGETILISSSKAVKDGDRVRLMI